MGSIDILKPLSTLLWAEQSKNPSDIKKFQIKISGTRELNWGLLAEKQEGYLCALQPPNVQEKFPVHMIFLNLSNQENLAQSST